MATQTRCPAATRPAGPGQPKSLPGTVRTQLPSAAFTSVTELCLAGDHPALLATVSREDLLSWIQAG